MGLQCQQAHMAPIMSGIHCTGWIYTFVFILPLFFAHAFENIVYQVRFSANQLDTVHVPYSPPPL